jgi:hypothetical protein
VSAVAYSTQKAPYKFPGAAGRWRVTAEYKAALGGAFGSIDAWYALTGSSGKLTVPIGSWDVGMDGTFQLLSDASGVRNGNFTLQPSGVGYTNANYSTTRPVAMYAQASATCVVAAKTSYPETLTSATEFFVIAQIVSATGTETFAVLSSRGATVLSADFGLL